MQSDPLSLAPLALCLRRPMYVLRNEVAGAKEAPITSFFSMFQVKIFDLLDMFQAPSMPSAGVREPFNSLERIPPIRAMWQLKQILIANENTNAEKKTKNVF
jgi:hypothetical protein